MKPSSDAPLVRFARLGKVYRDGAEQVPALRAVALDVGAGEFILVAGPSGCGKSTLLSIAGLLDAPTSGVYELAGRDASDLPADERARLRGDQIGFVFQSFNLIGGLTALENVELPLAYRGVPSDERRSRAGRALDRVGMADRAGHHPFQLFGGQQQRVSLARAVVGEPSLILADEPTGNLDSVDGRAVIELLAELNAAGATVMMVSHDPRHAGYPDRIAHLRDGRLVREERQPTSDGAARRGREPD